MKYIAEIQFSPKNKDYGKITVNVDKDIENTLYDEVEDAVYNEMSDIYPESDYPNAVISKLWIVDGGTHPVFRDGDKDGIEKAKKSKEYSKFLVLPEALYSISPECELWMGMMDKGLISKNSTFDYDTYHALVEKMRKNINIGNDTDADKISDTKKTPKKNKNNNNKKSTSSKSSKKTEKKHRKTCK